MPELKSNEPKYSPAPFSFGKKDSERLGVVHKNLSEKMGRVSKSHIVRAALFGFCKLPQDQQLDLLSSSELNEDVTS